MEMMILSVLGPQLHWRRDKAMATLTRIARDNGKEMPRGTLIEYKQGAKNEPRCRLECKYLTSADYKDLLWTTLAEFPGLLISLFAVDYLGRKKSMAICFFMFSLCILPLFACIGRRIPSSFRLHTGGMNQVMLRTSVYLTLSVYCGCSLLAAIASLILPIETLGRGLQESEHYQEALGQTTNVTSQSNGTTQSMDQ
ncbi:hypothetical protein GOODEAATRI_016731 [Goodea atripinnis]|uniref:Uncharacterized protein n=1 Tax=Goodea atripinnis TaxID=208336 RepID=A0ABV0NKW2_9TELE